MNYPFHFRYRFTRWFNCLRGEIDYRLFKKVSFSGSELSSETFKYDKEKFHHN